MPESPPPPFLFDLFSAAREELRLPLGIGEYFLLLEAVKHGHGLVGKEALRRLCETLWIKNERQRLVFREWFEQKMREELYQALALLEAAAKPREQSDSSGRSSSDSESGQPKGPSTQSQSQGAGPLGSSGPLEPEEREAEILLTMEEGEGELSLDEEELPVAPSMLAHRFVFSDSYLPLSDRQFRQNWRSLRSPTEVGWSEEIDLPGTIDRVARDGFFHQPVYLPAHENKIRLLLLIDHQGSMMPFRRLCEQVVETARSGGGQFRSQMLYFRNVPGDKLFLKPDRTRAISRKKLLQSLSGKYSNVLIVSDAGAARGNLHIDRLDATWDFLDELKAQVRHVAWLNPMPRERWPGTTAEHIADLLPMFEISPEGVRQAIRALRGKSGG